jgi:hypothetical protein
MLIFYGVSYEYLPRETILSLNWQIGSTSLALLGFRGKYHIFADNGDVNVHLIPNIRHICACFLVSFGLCSSFGDGMFSGVARPATLELVALWLWKSEC